MRDVLLVSIALFPFGFTYSEDALTDEQVYSVAHCLYSTVLPAYTQGNLDQRYWNASSDELDGNGMDQRRKLFSELLAVGYAPEGKVFSGITTWYRENFSVEELVSIYTVCQTPEFQKAIALRTKLQRHIAELTEDWYFDVLTKANEEISK